MDGLREFLVGRIVVKLLFLTASKERAHSIVEYCAEDLDRQSIDWSIGTDASEITPDLDLVYLLSYDRILDTRERARVEGRIVLFHSSDLPHGRGWAPIYHAIASGAERHTISLCYAGSKVDTGNILAKARLPIRPNYTAPMLRSVGQRAIARMIARYSDRIARTKPPGCPQAVEGTYSPRRTPDDARIDTAAPFDKAILHMLASEPPNLAFFEFRQSRFRVQIVPEDATICREFIVEEYLSGGHEPDAVISLDLPE
jgi:methionyl-tRNA formyltransferase